MFLRIAKEFMVDYSDEPLARYIGPDSDRPSLPTNYDGVISGKEAYLKKRLGVSVRHHAARMIVGGDRADDSILIAARNLLDRWIPLRSRVHRGST